MANEKIKDSGSTQEYSTGAHRDNATGKGRCDLLPLDEVSRVMGDKVLEEVGLFFKDNDTKHLFNALRNSVITLKVFDYRFITSDLTSKDIDVMPMETAEEKFKSCLAHMMLEASKLYEAGAIKYGPNNWKLGMPVERYLDSGVRHYLKTLRGDIDEPHYRGFVWNLLCAAWTAKNIEIKEPINTPQKAQ